MKVVFYFIFYNSEQSKYVLAQSPPTKDHTLDYHH